MWTVTTTFSVTYFRTNDELEARLQYALAKIAAAGEGGGCLCRGDTIVEMF